MAKAFLRAIVPKRIFDSAAGIREIGNAIDKTTREMRDDFEKTVQTWDHKVIFARIPASMTGNNVMSGFVGTDDEIYGYVTRGTSPHVIATPLDHLMVFQTGYTSKTMPRVLGSRRGGSHGPFVWAGIVHHPGTKAREFEESIARKWESQFERNVADAITRATKG